MESNERKGNYLRVKATRLVAGIELNLSETFVDFCNLVTSDLTDRPEYLPQSNLPLKKQIEKDAMLQIILFRLSNEDGVNVATLL